jgi:hypothetical protein
MSKKSATSPALLAGAVLLVAAAFGAGCSSSSPAQSGGEQDVNLGVPLYGNDRIGAALKTHPELVPRNYGDFETVFKVGRQCARTDAKEIFVVQEAQTRTSGASTGTSRRLPRAVITGCNTVADPADPVKASFSLMAALVSDDTASTDNMNLTHVESVALDDTTGEYNFYAFDDGGAGKPGTVTRTMRDGNGKVTSVRMTPGQPAKSIPVPFNCFGCHVNGGPLMNELTVPWTNWVSFVNPLPAIEMSGETLSIVKAAESASEFETIIEHAVSFTVEGTTPDNGFGLHTVKGTDPGGPASLFKSVFCQTELNYKTGEPSNGVPIELFVDPHATTDAQLVAPPVEPSDVFPFELPVRSAHDLEIETFLQITGYLTPNTVSAVRLVDDENDIFSKTRCDLLVDVQKSFPNTPADVDKHVRDILGKKLAANALGTMSMARSSYMAQLLKTTDGDPSLVPLHDAYIKDVTARYQTLTAQMQTANGRTALKALEAARKKSADAMFPGGGPLPILIKPAQ